MLPGAVPGLTLEDRFRIEERAGADALTRIYRASDLSTNTPVLVRLVHDHFAKLLSFSEEFVPRILGVRPLSHPGVLRTLSGGRAEAAGRAFLYTITEAFEGRNLCSIVHGRGLMPAGQVVLIAIQVLECLAAAHKKGVLHLDLRPESIVIGATPDGLVRPKIADFGLGSLAAECVTRIALGGSTLGTPLYASPERLRDEDVDERSDVYSMGAVLYEQLTGTLVFEANSAFELERLHLEQEPEPLRTRAPQRLIDAGVDAIVLKALRKAPADRYQTAMDMAAALVLSRGREGSEPGSSVTRRESRMLPSTLHLSVSGLSRQSGIVGREELTETLRGAALAPVDEANHGGVAILLGEAGMGKSAVVDELVAGLWGGPLGIVRVEGRRALHTPLEPFTEAARDLLGLHRGDTSARVQAIAGQLEQRGLASDDVLRLLDRVTGRASGLAVSLDVVEKEEVSALRSFFGHVLATVPGLLIIEDADALDPSSAAFALDLLQSTASHPVSVIVTARCEPWPEWKAPNAVRLRVNPLDPQHARAVLRERLVALELSPELVEAAIGYARGSPLLLELWARAMLAGKDPRANELLAASAGESSPALVEVVLASLRADARAWLQCAALAGVRAPLAMLRAWRPPAQGTSDAALLSECAATGLSRVEGDFLGFRNEAVRDMVTELTPERDRRDIHRFIAQWLAQVHPARGASEVIASQFESCGDLRQAAEHFEHAARNLSERGEPGPAAALFKRAAAVHHLASDTVNALRVGIEQVEALLLAGNAQGARDALSNLERLGAVRTEALRARILARIARAQGELESALKTLLSAATQGPLDELSRFELETDTAELLQQLGRLPDAREHAEAACKLAHEILEAHEQVSVIADSLRVSQSASFLSRLLASMSLFAEAREVLRESLARSIECDDEAAASRVLANLAFIASCEGLPAQAAEHAEQALGLARNTGDRAAAARVAINLAAYRIRLGNRHGAVETLLLARALSTATGWRRGVELANDALARLRS